MWIFTPEGFYSIVEPGPEDGHEGELMIRSRVEVDLSLLRGLWLPGLSETVATPARDYQFRAFATHEDVGEAMRRIVLSLDYDNFKDEVKRLQGPVRAGIYGRVWGTLHALGHAQDDLLGDEDASEEQEALWQDAWADAYATDDSPPF